jgi:large subunit ribosomal protein L24
MRLKKNDKVLILAGKDKGKTGEVREITPSKNKVLIAGVNMITKAKKASQNDKGGLKKLEAALDASNVAVICPKCKKACSPKIKSGSKGNKIRVCRKCQAELI